MGASEGGQEFLRNNFGSSNVAGNQARAFAENAPERVEEMRNDPAYAGVDLGQGPVQTELPENIMTPQDGSSTNRAIAKALEYETGLKFQTRNPTYGVNEESTKPTSGAGAPNRPEATPGAPNRPEVPPGTPNDLNTTEENPGSPFTNAAGERMDPYQTEITEMVTGPKGARESVTRAQIADSQGRVGTIEMDTDARKRLIEQFGGQEGGGTFSVLNMRDGLNSFARANAIRQSMIDSQKGRGSGPTVTGLNPDRKREEKINELMKRLPYGRPGDRAKRESMLKAAGLYNDQLKMSSQERMNDADNAQMDKNSSRQFAASQGRIAAQQAREQAAAQEAQAQAQQEAAQFRREQLNEQQQRAYDLFGDQMTGNDWAGAYDALMQTDRAAGRKTEPFSQLSAERIMDLGRRWQQYKAAKASEGFFKGAPGPAYFFGEKE
jgi:hypothetical protein